MTEKGKIQTAIEQVFDHIQKTYPGENWTLVSSLAEGADCLCVELAMRQPGTSLVVPLPSSIEKYLDDFTTTSARTISLRLLEKAAQVIVLPSQSSNHEVAYQLAGEYIVAHSQVLVAIWDGRAAQGSGGTGDVVDAARRISLPVAWILAGNRRFGTLDATTLGDQQGRVVFERFPEVKE